MTRGDGLTPGTRAMVNTLVQDMPITDKDLRRLQLVPDELLAKAFQYLRESRPGATDSYILRELIYNEVLRLGAAQAAEAGTDVAAFLRQMEERVAQVEERQTVLEQVYTQGDNAPSIQA